MELTNKIYKIIKIKEYLKNNSLVFFFNGINKKSKDWSVTEQELNSMSFSYYKVLNKVTTKTLNYSVYNNVVSSIINGITFLIQSFMGNQTFLKKRLTNSFQPLILFMLAIKLNNIIYSTQQLITICSLAYIENMLIAYIFNRTSLKQNLFFVFKIRNNGI